MRRSEAKSWLEVERLGLSVEVDGGVVLWLQPFVENSPILHAFGDQRSTKNGIFEMHSAAKRPRAGVEMEVCAAHQVPDVAVEGKTLGFLHHLHISIVDLDLDGLGNLFMGAVKEGAPRRVVAKVLVVVFDAFSQRKELSPATIDFPSQEVFHSRVRRCFPLVKFPVSGVSVNRGNVGVAGPREEVGNEAVAVGSEEEDVACLCATEHVVHGDHLTAVRPKPVVDPIQNSLMIHDLPMLKLASGDIYTRRNCFNGGVV